jgi:hypothetical protein
MWRHRCEIGTKVRTPSLQLMQLSDCVSLRLVENRASIVAFLRARFRILGELFIAPTQLRRARNVPKIPPFVKILIGTFLPATRPRYLHIRRANTSLNPDECLHAVECVLVGGDCTFRIVHLNCLSRVLRDRISKSFRNLTTQCVDVRSPN